MIRTAPLAALVLLLWLGLGSLGPLAAQTTPLKPPIRGLVSMGGIAFHLRDGGVPNNSLEAVLRIPGVFAGVVLNLTWEQLEPNPDGLAPLALEQALADVRTYNQAHSEQPLAVRLRVWPGPNAPAWAKALGGPPVAILHRGLPITVGRFWAADYRAAWRAMHWRLAARFDAEPLIQEVSATSCSSITDEMVLLPTDPTSMAALHAAGFTDLQFRDCLEEAAHDYDGWGTVRVELPMNPYRGIDTGRPVLDPAITVRLMTRWRQQLGPRAVLGAHSLLDPLLPHLEPVYEMLRELGPPLAFQTHAPNGLDWEGAIRVGVARGATSVEVWIQTPMGSLATMPAEALRGWTQMLGQP